MVMEDEAFSAPLLSVATAVKLYFPAGTLFQAKVQGLDVFSPSLVSPLKNSTLEMVPSVSDAFAMI